MTRKVLVIRAKEGLRGRNAELFTIVAAKFSCRIDIVGAGDSTMAGIVSALCCGATLEEAALVGQLVASVTIKCLGTTGTASQEQVRAALARWRAAHVRAQ